MKHKSFFKLKATLVAFGLCCLAAFSGLGQTKFTEADKAEFAGRRDRLFEKIKDGIAVFVADEEHIHAVKFRQSPDFFYLTGIEEPGAVLLLDGKTKQSYLFTYRRSAGKIRSDGPGLLESTKPEEVYGLTQVLSMENMLATFNEHAKGAQKLYIQITPPDTLQKARGEIVGHDAAIGRQPLYSYTPLYKQAANKFRELQPQLTQVDISPVLSEMRWVKTPYEIERLRRAGQIGAEALKEAIRWTKPGMFEYELEAALSVVYAKMGSRHGFTPIVASGPNMMTWHYQANSSRMESGNLVLIDTGADYGYYVSDITRTWAVNGKFTPEQEKMYRCVLEASQSVIAMMKPGVTIKQMQDVAEEVYKKYGYQKEFLALGRYIGHHVGLSVHDVNPPGGARPMVPGVVYNVEPILEIPEKKIHIRLEDTILITPNGAENLTAGIPAGVAEITALIKERGKFESGK